MGMNNVYYRSLHLLEQGVRDPAGALRMNVIANPGVEKATSSCGARGLGDQRLRHVPRQPREGIARGGNRIRRGPNRSEVSSIIQSAAVALEAANAAIAPIAAE